MMGMSPPPYPGMQLTSRFIVTFKVVFRAICKVRFRIIFKLMFTFSFRVIFQRYI